MPNQPHYYRPTTRGELVAKLEEGVACEVVTHNVKTTKMLVDNWLTPPPYTIRPSENQGWTVFELKGQP